MNDQDTIQKLYLFSKHAIKKGALTDQLTRMRATSHHMIAALLLHNEKITNTIRRELKRVAEVSVSDEEIIDILRDEVIKREAQDGPDADQARDLVNQREGAALRKRAKKMTTPEPPELPEPPGETRG